jgi:hypothetical protein
MATARRVAAGPTQAFQLSKDLVHRLTDEVVRHQVAGEEPDVGVLGTSGVRNAMGSRGLWIWPMSVHLITRALLIVAV